MRFGPAVRPCPAIRHSDSALLRSSALQFGPGDGGPETASAAVVSNMTARPPPTFLMNSVAWMREQC
eukprot:412511-Rhodomonas_salina.1